MKFARRLILALLAGLLVVHGVNGVERYRREAALLEEDMRRDHNVMGRGVAAAVGELWADEGRARALDIVARANEREDRVTIRWIDLSPQPAEAEAPLAPPEVVAPVARGEAVDWVDAAGEGRLVSYVPLRVDGQWLGAIELSESLDQERAFLRATLLRMVVTTAILALMSAGIALFVGIVFVGRPIRHLVDRARQIGQGDFSAGDPYPPGDELGELAREMEAMAARLAASRAALDREMVARARADEQLRHAERLTTVGKLAAGIAHELGTPLNVIAQRARLVATGEVEGAAVRDNARIVVEQADRITRIVRQLLDFARARTPEIRAWPLQPAVERATSLLEPLARRSGVALKVAPGAGDVRARFDPEQVQQVLANLLVNAVQASSAGGAVTIAVGREDRDPAVAWASGRAWAIVTVADTGAGIRPEDLGKVFDPFFTTKRVGEGTGLGLSVAYGIVREHGGWIEVRSEPGAGSVFTVVLPREDG